MKYLIKITIFMTCTIVSTTNSAYYDNKLFRAAQKGVVADVDRLLKQGYNPNPYVDDVGCEIYTPLHVAAKAGNLEVVKRLLQDPRTDITLKSEEGERMMGRGGFTPLHYAAMFGRPEVVDELLKVSENKFGLTQQYLDFINATNESNQTAFDLAQQSINDAITISKDKWRPQPLDKARIQTLENIKNKIQVALQKPFEAKRLAIEKTEEYVPKDVALVIGQYIETPKEPNKQAPPALPEF